MRADLFGRARADELRDGDVVLRAEQFDGVEELVVFHFGPVPSFTGTVVLLVVVVVVFGTWYQAGVGNAWHGGSSNGRGGGGGEFRRG